MAQPDNVAERIVTELLSHQSAALEKLAVATESIACAITLFISDSLKVALVYPWSNDPSVVRAVLLHGAEEERRLTEALPRFDVSKETGDLEEWLKKENFKMVKTVRLSLGRKAHETVKARSSVGGSRPEKTEADGAPMPKLELEEAPMPKLELESPSS